MNTFFVFWIVLTIAYCIYFAICVVIDLRKKTAKPVSSEVIATTDMVEDEEEEQPTVVDVESETDIQQTLQPPLEEEREDESRYQPQPTVDDFAPTESEVAQEPIREETDTEDTDDEFEGQQDLTRVSRHELECPLSEFKELVTNLISDDNPRNIENTVERYRF